MESASKSNPLYRVQICTSTTRYVVTQAVVSIEMSEQEKQLAASADINLMDVDVNGSKISSLISSRDRVYIFTNDGSRSEEVFRGYIWNISHKENLTESAITLKCYDNLIYWQESEHYEFFSSGKLTVDILSLLGTRIGLNSVVYKYENIIHGNLVLRGAIADFVTEDLLNVVQKQVGKPYVLRSEVDRIVVREEGTNERVYTISKANNATEVRRFISMNGVVTLVSIYGTASDDEKMPVEAVESGEFGTYGILRKIITRNEDTTLEQAKSEAQNIIKEKGKPKWEYDVKATDIPWIRKGDGVRISCDTLEGAFIVKSISREISNKGNIMTLTVVDY